MLHLNESSCINTDSILVKLCIYLSVLATWDFSLEFEEFQILAPPMDLSEKCYESLYSARQVESKKYEKLQSDPFEKLNLFCAAYK